MEANEEIENGTCEVELDNHGKPTFIVIKNDINGTTIMQRRVPFGKTSNKYYDIDIFPKLIPPKDFDNQAVIAIPYKEQVKYLTKNVSDADVIKMQGEIVKSLLEPNLKSIPGYLGRGKLESTLDINMATKTIFFLERVTNEFQTIAHLSNNQLLELQANDFHLFPNKENNN